MAKRDDDECVCVCVWERERERERESMHTKIIIIEINFKLIDCVFMAFNSFFLFLCEYL